jgi:hypothetical protein
MIWQTPGNCAWDKPEGPGPVTCTICGVVKAAPTQRRCGKLDRNALPPQPFDTGDVLHDLIRRKTKQEVRPGCKCLGMMQRMNHGGPEWTRQHIDEIVLVMLEEAQIRGLILNIDVPAFAGGPSVAPEAARRLVLKAARISERRARRK